MSGSFVWRWGAAAVRYKDAIDSAVEAARALGTATSDFAPKDRGDGPDTGL